MENLAPQERMEDPAGKENQDFLGKRGEDPAGTQGSQEPLAGKDSRDSQAHLAWCSKAPMGVPGCLETSELKVPLERKVIRVKQVTQPLSAPQSRKHGAEPGITQQVPVVGAQDNQEHQEYQEYLDRQVKKVSKDCQERPGKVIRGGKDSLEPQDQEFQAQKDSSGCRAGRGSVVWPACRGCRGPRAGLDIRANRGRRAGTGT